MKQLFRLGAIFFLLAGAGRWSPCPGQNLVVNTINDTDDGACDATHCSLREAIAAANLRPGPDRITFALPGGAPFQLLPVSPLPALTDAATVIDGSTQAGVGAEGVILEGGALTVDADGLVIRGADCAVLGLQVRGFAGAGILVSGARGARIGSDQARQGNVLVANGEGIRLEAGAASTIIEGNFVGLLPFGAAEGNRTGIAIDGLVAEVRDTRIGGPAPAAGNTIGGNTASGIFGRNAVGLVLLSNRIGADRLGLDAVPNQLSGIDLNDCRDITIGRAPFSGNVISGNGEHGILLRQFRDNQPLQATIEANRIGCDRPGEAALSNRRSGIYLEKAVGIRIGAGNLISGNRSYGIAGDSVADLTITGNTIGVNGSATLTLANGAGGLFLKNSRNVTVADNLLAGNTGNGVALTACAQSSLVRNVIGVSQAGLALRNTRAGVRLTNCREVRVGEPLAGEGNTIAHHPEGGIVLEEGSMACPVRGNSLYCNSQGLLLTAGANADMPAPKDLCVTVADVTGVAAPGSTVDVYRHDAEICPDSPCQGRIYLGSVVVRADSLWTFSGDFPADALVTATATDGAGNTSAFSVCRPVTERPIARAANDGEVCPGARFALRGTGEAAGDLRYEWRGPEGYRSAQQNPDDAIAAGWYYLFVRHDGCRSLPDSTEARNRGPVELTIGDDPSEWICPGDSVVVNGTVYNLANPRGVEHLAGPGPACDTVITIDLRIREAVPGRLEATLCPGESLVVGATTFDERQPSGRVLLPGAAVSGCDSVVEVSVRFVALEAVVAGRGVSCSGAADGSVVLFQIGGGTAPYRVTFAGRAPAAIDVLPHRFDGLSAGQYDLELEDGEGCRRSLSVTVDPPARRFLYAGGDVTLDFGDSLQLRPNLNFEPDSLRWSPSSSLSCADCLMPVARPAQTTTYTLTARTPEGCRLSTSVTVAVDAARFLFIPNAFSPNGDGVNDRFILFGNGKSVRNIRSLRIFDRWGDLLYESGGFAPGDGVPAWDGNTRGRPAPAGVYVYAVDVILADGSTRQWSGEVSLLR